MVFTRILPVGAMLFTTLVFEGCGKEASVKAGRDGLATVVNVTAEAAGANCDRAGSKVESGVDRNANGVLDTGEVTSTSYVCAPADGVPGNNGENGTSGENGIDGENGTDGLITRVSVTPEPAGGNCATGGSKVEAGLDSDSDGVLDPGEITTTSYVCTGPGVQWREVTTATQAQPNTGYLAGGDAQVAITLPTDLAIGDIVRVSGVSAGGWKVTQNAGQSISTPGIASGIGVSWTPREETRSWNAVASSADGMRLVAAVEFGQLYTSTDAGVSWTAREQARDWNSVASSADGSKLVATGHAQGLHRSTDAGANWTFLSPYLMWECVASSADGTHLVAAEWLGALYTSTDGGLNWTNTYQHRTWKSLASSADGTRLVGAAYNSQVSISTDKGVSWTPRGSTRDWRAVASSADGMRLLAAVNDGQLYTSADAGASWDARESNRSWRSVASSADGTKLVAAAHNGQLYMSRDAGVSWTARDSNREWISVASSADGTKLVAAARGGQIFTSKPGTTPGVTGAISGYQNEALELQYMGNGVFTVLSHSGDLQVE